MLIFDWVTIVAIIAVGIFMGLIGAGGSAMLIPLLVYGVGLHPIDATTYSLFIIGVTSAVGCIHLWRRQLVDLRSTILFAIPAMTSIYLVRRFLLPGLPDPLITFYLLTIDKHLFLMLIFAVVLIISSIYMMKKSLVALKEINGQSINYLYTAVVGLSVGFISGLIGTGGGFMITPALVFFVGLPVRLAIGTSMTVIAINSLFGFGTDVIHSEKLNWEFLFLCSCITIPSMLVGMYLASYIPGNRLRHLFGLLMLAIGVMVLFVELILPRIKI